MLKYVIITPVRNEEAYIAATIKSVIQQSLIPLEWVIVNDGSQDNTGKIIDDYARQYDWIRTTHVENRGFRKAGGGVVETFYKGYSLLTSNDYDFLVKLDGDLAFEADYFEKCFGHFERNPGLGIGGGFICNFTNGRFVVDNTNPLFHVRGATKIYRRECWKAIDGLISAPGWDTLDEVKANMLNWETCSFPELKIFHLRPTGAADGTWTNWVKNGRANYFSGYHPLFMIFKCMKRVFQKPYFVISLALFWGFMKGYLMREKQVNDLTLIKYLRKQQLRKLLLMNTIWK